MKIRLALAVFAWLAASACGLGADGPPLIEVDRTACAHCRMLVSDVAYAAAFQVAGAEARVFDDIGCMAAELRQAAGERRVWVHDFGTGEWIDGAGAVFVHAAALRTPMGGGVIAFKTRAAAERSAGEKNGRVVASLAEVLASGGKDGRQ